MKNVMIFFWCVAFIRASQPDKIVHCPTAGLLDHAQFYIDVWSFPEGGMRVKFALGLWDRLQLGVSYGALGVVERGLVNADPRPEWEIRGRIIQEGIKNPALVLGIDTRGFGAYNRELYRYEHKSRGIFAVASKNWWFLGGNLGIHGGLNYSLEEKLARGFSAFVGFDKDIKEACGVRVEYDLAPADRESPRGNGYGFLSASFFLHFVQNGWIYFNFYDLLGNVLNKRSPARELGACFIKDL